MSGVPADQPCLFFGRTRMAISSIPECDEEDGLICMPYGDGETILAVNSTGQSGNPLLSLPWAPYFEYMEILGARPNAVHRELNFNDDMLFENEELPEPYLSEEVARALNRPGMKDAPSFGRRLLCVEYTAESTHHEREIFRRRLGGIIRQHRLFWSGRHFEAIGFTEARREVALREILSPPIETDVIEDFLIVEPTHLIMPDRSGLSPMQDWLAHRPAHR